MGELHNIAVNITKTVGYKTTVGPTDRSKVDAELRGERKPTCSSLMGQQIVRLARLDPPTGTPPPLPASAISPFFARDGVFVRSLSSFTGELRVAAKSAGFTAVYIQLDHSGDVERNINELALIGDTLIRDGWLLGGWATYGQGTDASSDGARHARIRRDLDRWLDGWVANGEAWAEDAGYGKSAEWAKAWTNNGGFGPLAVSCLSSDNPNWARHFDYPTWLAIPGCAIMPQVYGASYPAYTVTNAVSTMANGGVNRNRLNLTFDVIQGAGPFVNYRTWAGPRSVWTGDDSTLSTWAALAR
jgi:hypothetical protein